MLDLYEEPLAFSMYQEEDDGRLWLSDVPEAAMPSLVEAFGREAVDYFIRPTETELEYFMKLPAIDRRPRYLELLDSGELERRASLARETTRARTAPYFMAAINLADEAILGRAGIIYFVCRKGCHFCQYRDFPEQTLDVEQIAERMIALQKGGADTIQWLSPSAYSNVLVQALFVAAKEGLTIPLVHKSEGEDSLEDLALLRGMIDMYLPDVKFIRASSAEKIGLSASYPERMKPCIREMYDQVGPLFRRPGDTLALGGGLLVRHLLMPNGVEEAKLVLAFLGAIDRALPMHVMTSYQPLHDALKRPDIARRVTREEIAETIRTADELGLSRAYFR